MVSKDPYDDSNRFLLGSQASGNGNGNGIFTPCLQAAAAAVGVLFAVFLLTFAANFARLGGDLGANGQQATPDLIALAKRGNPWERFSRVPVATGRLPDVMRLESDTQQQPMGWLHNVTAEFTDDPMKGAYIVFSLGELTYSKKDGMPRLLPKPLAPRCMSCAKNDDLAKENLVRDDGLPVGFDKDGLPLASSEEAYARKKHAVRQLFTPLPGPFVALVGDLDRISQVRRPAIAVLPNGDTLLVASCGDPLDDKPLLQSRLPNGYDPETGRGARFTMWKHVDGLGNQPPKHMHDYPALLVDDQSKIVHLFYTRWPAYDPRYDLASRSIIMRSESRDFGESWSIAEVAVPAARGHRTGGPGLVSRLTGEWLLPLRRRDKDALSDDASPAGVAKSYGEFSSVVSRSGDQGLTWDDSTIAGGPGTPQRGFLMDPRLVTFDVEKPQDEGVFAFFGKRQQVFKEKIVALLQDDSDVRRIRAISSEDGGATWRDPLRTPLPSRNVSYPIAACADKRGGKGLYVVFDNSPKSFRPGTVLSIAYSGDGGRSFPFVRDLDTSLMNTHGEMAEAQMDPYLQYFEAHFMHPACATDDFGNVNIVYETTLAFPEWRCGKRSKKHVKMDMNDCYQASLARRTVIKWLRVRSEWVQHSPGLGGSRNLTGIYRGDMLSSWVQNSERARAAAAAEMLGRVAPNSFDEDVELLRKKLRHTNVPPPPPTPPTAPPPPPPALPPYPGNYFGSTISQEYHRAEMERRAKAEQGAGAFHRSDGKKTGKQKRTELKKNALEEQLRREKEGKGYDMGLDLMMSSDRFFPREMTKKDGAEERSKGGEVAPGTSKETRGSQGWAAHYHDPAHPNGLWKNLYQRKIGRRRLRSTTLRS